MKTNKTPEQLTVLLTLLFFGVVALLYGLNRDKFTTTSKTYEIACETQEGWVKYQTHVDPLSASRRNGGVWHFENLNGETITSTNCFSKH